MPLHDDDALHGSWQRLYRAGAWSALVYVILVLVPVVLVFAAPVPPATGAALLEYIGAHRMVYLVELVCFVGLSVPALVVFSALGVALAHVDRSVALIGALLGVVSEAVALALGSSPQSLNGGLVMLATTYRSAAPDARPGLVSAADALIAATNAVSWAGILTAAAILVLSVVMLRTGLPAWVAVLGIVAGAVGIVSEALRPLMGTAYLLYGLLLPLWFALVGWRLRAFARAASGGASTVTHGVAAVR